MNADWKQRLADWISRGLRSEDAVAPGLEAGEEAAGQGLDPVLEHSWPWPPWVTLLLLIAAVIYVLAIYFREGGTASRWLRVTMAGMRIGVIAVLLVMLYGWMLRMHQTDLPDLVVILDDSASLLHRDHFDTDQLREKLAEYVTLDEEGKTPRVALAKALLTGDKTDWLEKLQARYNLKLYFLATHQRLQTGDLAALKERVESLEIDRQSEEAGNSRLGNGVRGVIESQRGRPTAAIVLLTDGVTTEGRSLSEVAEYAKQKSIPLYLVGLGHDKPSRDLRLNDLLVDEVVFAGDLVTFTAKVTNSGFAGQTVRVRLTNRDTQEIVDEKSIKLSDKDETRTVRLTWRPSEEGEFPFTMEVVPLEGESNPNNNSEDETVTVRNETIRVLLVQDYPNYEFRYLKTLLHRGLKLEGDESERAFELTTVLQQADPDYAELDDTAQRVFPVSRTELFDYDVVIFGDVNPSFLTQSVVDNLTDFVKERGGGLMFLAGPRYTPLALRNTSLAQLMPIDLASASLPPPDALLNEGFQPEPTRLGVSSPQLQLSDSAATTMRIWNELPPLYWLLESPDLRPGARVLMQHPTRTGPTGEKLPLITMQFVGAGKVIFHHTDETYRWAMHPDGELYYARYWMQTLRFLSRSKLLGKETAAELTSDRQRYYRGETIRLRARFLDERQAPEQEDGVTVVLEKEGSRQRHVRLTRDAANRGIFEGAISNLPDGEYTVWLATPVLEDAPVPATFTVRAPPGEQARLEMDADDLRKAARTSGGKFYTIANAARLPRDLPEGRQVRIKSLPPQPVWNSSILAALFVGLIVGEWLLRKRAGLL